ncbi:hypothetical protein CC80DRAFT_354485, partial [Byssothecium circinans]
THVIRVGASGDLIFDPNNLDAGVGDMLRFEFFGNHTLTQSSLSKPCTASGAFDADFVFDSSGGSKNQLLFLVQSSNPQWFFCRQILPSPHCSAGMVFGLNPGNLMEDFLANAK